MGIEQVLVELDVSNELDSYIKTAISLDVMAFCMVYIIIHNNMGMSENWLYTPK